jgi:putative flippase GtrA
MTAILLKITTAWYERPLLAKLISFASVGVLNFAVDLTTFAVAFHISHLSLVTSNIIAWVVAVTGSYAMNTKITFGKETGGILRLRHYISFAASGIFGLIVATTLLVVISRYIGVPAAKLVSIAASFGVNFSTSHFLVFRDSRAELGQI